MNHSTLPIKDTIKDHLKHQNKSEPFFIAVEYPKLVGRDKNRGVVLSKYPILNWPLSPTAQELEAIISLVKKALVELNQEGYKLTFEQSI